MIYEAVLADRLRFEKELKETGILIADNHLTDLIPAYHSLTLIFHHAIKNEKVLIKNLKKIYSSITLDEGIVTQLLTIPVCYDPQIAPDLYAYSEKKCMSIDEIVALHTANSYQVYFIGFMPGFLYLGGLDERLHCARKAAPELHLPKGAVAIGGEQTGVYPQESPGGWHVIGISPVNFFNPLQDPVCFAAAGDHVKFESVDFDEFQQIKLQVEQGEYAVKSEVWNA